MRVKKSGIRVVVCSVCKREVVARGDVINPHADMKRGGWCKGAAKGEDALQPVPAKDVQLRPNVDGVCRLDYGDDGARSAFKKWSLNKNGKDSSDALAPVPVKDADPKVGQRVVLVAGNGAKGGMAGQDFMRLAKNSPATITDIRGSNIWVRLDDDPKYKWAFHRHAIEGQLDADNAEGKDSFGALTVAALLAALWAWYHRQPEPQDYNLNTYRPKRQEW